MTYDQVPRPGQHPLLTGGRLPGCSPDTEPRLDLVWIGGDQPHNSDPSGVCATRSAANPASSNKRALPDLECERFAVE